MPKRSHLSQDTQVRLEGRLPAVVRLGLLLLYLCLPGAALAQQFAEVGAAAGVASPEGGISMAWGDYDGDGDLDLYLTTRGENRLYRNNGNGRFTEVAAIAGVDYSGGSQALWGDYDGDGDLDLYLVNRRGANRLYRNNGNANHWLALQLSGTASNRSAIGAQVVAVTGALRQHRQVEGPGLRAQASLPVELGFGGAQV